MQRQLSLQIFALIMFAGCLLGTGCLLGIGSAIQAQGTPQLMLTSPYGEATEVTLEQIEEELGTVESDSKLDETLKAQSKEILTRAKRSLENAAKESDQASQYKAQVASATTQTEELTKQLKRQTKEEIAIDAEASVESLSQRMATVNAELQAASARADVLAGEPTRRRARLAEIPTLVSNTNRSLADVNKQLSQPPAANESKIESEIRELFLKAQSKELRAVADRLEQEQAAYLATTELVPLETKIVAANVQRLEQESKLLQDAVVALQAKKARETTRALQKTTNAVPESLRELAQQNLDLAKSQTAIILQSKESQESLAQVRSAVEEVTNELKTSEARVAAVGLTDALGLMFRERRHDFDQLRFKFRPSDKLKNQIQQYQIESFKLEDELARVKHKLEQTDAPEVDWEQEGIDWDRLSEKDAHWVLLRKRQKLIENANQTQNELLQTLLNSDFQSRQLMQEVDRFDDFADKHLFWTRSAPALSPEELKVAPKTLTWITQSDNWMSAGKQMWDTGLSRPLSSLAMLLIMIAVWYTRPRFRRTIVSEGKEAHRFNATFRSTLQSLSATACAATAWPILFGFFGYLCLANSTGNPFVKGLGYGLAVAALFIASRTFLKEICREDGLGDAHFGWQSENRMHLRRHLRWNMLFGGIAIFFLAMYHEHPDTMVRTFATRMTSTALFIITAIFHHCILGSRSPLFPELVRNNPNSFIYRWRKLIWAIAVGLPVVFGFMSMAGYLETTFRLGRSLQSTFFLLVFVVVLLGLLSRWLTLYRRDVARRNAAELRERLMASSPESEASNVANEAGIVLEDETQMDLPTLDYQTRLTAFVIATILALLGLAYIWSDLVPALGYLDEINVWSIGNGDSLETVTLKDLICALLSIAAVFFAVRNLPSMLELLVLSRTRLDGGARYAIATLLRYALIIVGVLMVLYFLRLPLQQLGWLAAAASVGLGFGLQEIVANFVSGIILLLERPVRVGDVVTIDGTTGIVSRIQMRATTVTNWDRKELVIPNKDLITQKLLNWSLSNVVNRLTIEVGVAYGSDPNLVRKILSDVVSKHPEVLEDPPPLINFETFGDNSLNFIIRFFLPKLDNRIEVTHQVNTAIAQALAEANISIPFPQRDIHVFNDAGSQELGAQE